MAREPRHIVREWLDAEAAGQPDEADRRFRLVAAKLPRLRPSAAFADAILVRAGMAPAAPDVWASWWLRGLIGAALLSAGALAVSLSPDAWFSALVGSVRTVAWAFGDAWLAVQAWVGGALAVWSGLSHAAVVTGRLLAGPDAVLLLVLNLTVAAAALIALGRLIPSQEN